MNKHMPPGRAGKKLVKSRVISARLNPEFAEERAALKVFDDLVEQEYSPRQIITHAILQANGYTPEMFHKERSDAVVVALEEQLMHLDLKGLSDKIDAIYDFIAHQIIDVLRNVKSADPDAFRSFANQESGDDMELDEEFVRNAQRAARKTFKQRHAQGDD